MQTSTEDDHETSRVLAVRSEAKTLCRCGCRRAYADGFLAAAHIFVTSFPANASNLAIAAGFAAGTGPSPAPEPATLALVGLGLAALAGYAGAGRK